MEQSFFLLVHRRKHQYDEANLQNFVSPTRYSWLTAFAGKYVNEWVTLSASALATVINEKAKNGGSAGNHRKLSPNVSISLKPFHNEELRFRFFYKDIFRLPSISMIYITTRPETSI